ncbi:hypothetical cytosolic protein [Syntrophus aciditrophicus SB]|uniref:Hypothetical cytosolic protein n=1 Tax=Syntrophus aciditrophicus (strain SB) TaxID=56780 RepID=Q2LSJ7_SYNAS|nr:hypothetical cytosolic protein [Syntrophus aciditrophicus SB]
MIPAGTGGMAGFSINNILEGGREVHEYEFDDEAQADFDIRFFAHCIRNRRLLFRKYSGDQSYDGRKAGL